MQLAMMEPADRNRKLVADLAAQRPGLGKTQMVRVGGRAAADETRLSRYELAVLLVAKANGLARKTGAFGDGFFGCGSSRFCAIGIGFARPRPRPPSARARPLRFGRTKAKRGELRRKGGDDDCGIGCCQ